VDGYTTIPNLHNTKYFNVPNFLQQTRRNDKMALLFCDGFDKYGGVNSNATIIQALLTAGEWTSAAATSSIVAGLSATGYAFATGTGANTLTKTLAASYSRLIGGIRFSSGLVSAAGIQFIDAASSQCGICINPAGTIAVRNGSFSAGTILGTSAVSVSANTTHYLEWDITFGNSAAYQLWLDGVSILSSTGDTTATANNSASGFSINGTGGVISTWDDLYLFDATGTTNNAVLLTSPRIETQFPNGDGAVQFAVGAAILGSSVTRSYLFSSNAANQWRTRPFTPTRNCTLNSISFLPNTTNAALNFRPMVYSDSAGLPGTLLSAGATVTGMTANTAVIMPLTTPQALTAGTQYWLGYMCDVVSGGASLYNFDTSGTERIGVSTFASGAPSTPPSLSVAATTLIWGSITGTGVNWYEVSQNPAQGSNSYVYDTAVGHEDLYTFPALSAIPSAIYAVAVKTIVSKTDAGAKTMSVRCKSGATDSAGTSGTIAPGTTYAWVSSLFPTDPNTSAAWTLAALNAAQAGVKVES
jgi:hypothetical protein